MHTPETRPLIAGLVFVDPIPFLLHLPQVAYNFLHRTPRHANELMLWWFVGTEAGICWSLGRHFWWYRNILWRNELRDLIAEQRARVSVLIAGKDAITPAPLIYEYLRRNRALPAGTKYEEIEHATADNGVEIAFYRDFDHAQCLVSARAVEDLASKCRAYCTD